MSMRRTLLRVALIAVAAIDAALVIVWALPRDEARVLQRRSHPDGSHSLELVSPAYTLDRIFRSMQGPHSIQEAFRMSDELGGDATIWLTAVETSVVDANTLAPVSNEFFCHSNLTLNPGTSNPTAHNASFEVPLHAGWRFFTLVPGRMEIRLPDGFGIPVKNGTALDYLTMALNQNPGQPERRIRMKTRLRYRTAGRGPIEPLFFKAVYVYQQFQRPELTGELRDGAATHAHVGALCGESCPFEQLGATPSTFAAASQEPQTLEQHPGATCCVVNASSGGILEQFGDANTIHWIVPPGKHVFRSEVTQQLDLPFDTTVHYTTGHLHPFGQSLKLVDMETGETVIHIASESLPDRLGVASMSETTSVAGIPLRQSGRYELIAEYDNASDTAIDAMAILYLYARDQSGDAPTLAENH